MAEDKSGGTSGLIAVFGENDGGHSFVTLCDTIEANTIHEVIPQEDVWSTVEAIRNGSAQVAVVPLSNSITQTEAATLQALASGDVKILARVRKQTNHVLVGVKDYINAVDANFKGSFGTQRDGAYSSLDSDHDGSQGGSHEPDPKGLARFVLLLRKVFSSTTVYEQTRGKLRGSDFRHDIQLEHTANPVRVLIRYYKERETQVVWDGLEGNNRHRGAPMIGGLQPQYPTMANSPIALQPAAPPPPPVDHDYFGAALVAEGLLSSAQKICDMGRRQCSQRLSEVLETLRELRINSEPPRDLPNNETTFLVIGTKAQKVNLVWEDGVERRATEIRKLQDEIDRLSIKSKKLADDPTPRVQEERKAADDQIEHLEGEIKSLQKLVLGPRGAPCSWRASFLLKLSSDGDWNRAFKAFEEKIKMRFPDLKLKFDQAPDRLQFAGKSVLLITARVEGLSEKSAKSVADNVDRVLNAHRVKRPESALGLSWLSDKMSDDQSYDPKLLGIYPSWIVRGAMRTWDPEPISGKDVPAKIVPTASGSGWGVFLFVALWLALIFVITLTSTPFGQAWLYGLWSNLIGWIQTLFLGPG